MRAVLPPPDRGRYHPSVGALGRSDQEMAKMARPRVVRPAAVARAIYDDLDWVWCLARSYLSPGGQNGGGAGKGERRGEKRRVDGMRCGMPPRPLWQTRCAASEGQQGACACAGGRQIDRWRTACKLKLAAAYGENHVPPSAHRQLLDSGAGGCRLRRGGICRIPPRATVALVPGGCGWLRVEQNDAAEECGVCPVRDRSSERVVAASASRARSHLNDCFVPHVGGAPLTLTAKLPPE